MEKEIIDKIDFYFRQIKKGVLPKDTKIGYCLNKIKEVNVYLYEDKLKEYKNILK
jgi:hypothetical protein